VSPVFAHGRLRLYLLKLLDESPRHGYDVIRLLEDRFMGMYAPSPGTIYPRLQRLEIRDEVRGTVRDLKQELKQAAREIRREQRHENRSRRGRQDDRHRWDWRGEGLDGRLWEFLDRTQRAMRRVQLTEAQVRECAAILDEAFERIRQTLKDTGERPQDHRGANQ
jgi:DNA-binding PadR family transcriptional regulator